MMEKKKDKIHNPPGKFKSPAFLFYPNDWLGSSKITLMSPSEEGMYIRLLCHMWATDNCSLPSDEHVLGVLSRVALVEREDRGDMLKALIKKAFIPHPEHSDKLTNLRLYKEFMRQKEFYSMASVRGQEGAKKRWGKHDLSNAKTWPYPYPYPYPLNTNTDIEGEGENGKRVNPEIKLFIDYAFSCFQKKFGEKLLIDGKKDGEIVRKLLLTYGLEKLKGCWDKFMQSTDPFIRQAGYSIGVFKSQINKLLTAGKAQGGRTAAGGVISSEDYDRPVKH